MFKKLLIVSLILLGIILLFFFNPENTAIYPRCPFKLLTGLQCPGCGLQRSAYCLLHGEWRQAICHNIILFVFLPYLLLLVLTNWFDPNNKYKRLRNFCLHNYTVYVCLFILLVWGVVRNILGI